MAPAEFIIADERDQRAQRRAVARQAAQAARAQREQQAQQQQQNQVAMAANIDANIQAAIDAAVAVVAAQLATTQGQLMTARAELLQARTDLNTLQNAQVAPAAPAAAPTFALGPATVSTDVIDYSTPAGIKLYKLAGEKLKTSFALETASFTMFTDNLHSRATEQGWDNKILSVTHNGTNMYVLRNYGTLTYTSVLAHAQAYAFTTDRQAQDSNNLFKCLEATLTEEAMRTMYAERHLYTLKRGDIILARANVANAPATLPGRDDDEFSDGVLMLWAVINRTTAQTNATISAIINQLTRLNTIMEDSKHDIKVFNTSIRDLLNQYVANRRHEYDQTILINSLFSAYKTTKDKEFSLYITRKQQDHDDNSKILTANTLMDDALKFYQTRITLKEWEQDSDEVKEIINLSAQLKKSQGKIADLEKKLDGKGKGKEGEKKDGSNNSKNKYEGLTPEQIRKKRFDEAPSWMKRRPKNPTPTSTKVKDNKTYLWCDKHKMWCYHNTLDCKLKKKENASKNENNNNNNEGGGSGSKDQDKDPGGGHAAKKVTYGPHTSMVLDGWDEY